MDSLEDLRKKKLAELQAEMEQAQAVQAEIDNIEEFAKKWLTKEALVRFGSLKSAHPEKAVQVAIAIAQGVKSGQIRQLVDDGLLKAVLTQMEPEKKKTIIRRK